MMQIFLFSRLTPFPLRITVVCMMQIFLFSRLTPFPSVSPYSDENIVADIRVKLGFAS